MYRETIEKTVLTVVLVAWWLFLPAVGYENGDTENIPAHLFYMLSHANIWHLAANLFFLWFFLRGRLYLIPSMLIGFLVSLLPGFSIYGEVGLTMGFSGVLFAIAGIKWGVYCRYASSMGKLFESTALHDFFLKAIPFALIGILIPHINWTIHLYAMLAGFVYGRCRR